MDRAARTLDEWIALRCKLGEAEAFDDLVRLMERPLLYYATKLLRNEDAALDVLQEVWFAAFRNIRKVKDPASLRPWLYKITRGIAVDRIRKELARERSEDVQAKSATLGDDNPSFESEDAAAIHEGLNELDTEHRDVLTLHFLDDLSIAEIAAATGCPEGTVKSRIHYGKQTLKQILMRGGYGKRK